MPANSAFDYPPLFGNAISFVIYYAVFLVVQIGLSFRYLRSWNWPIFLGLLLFLVFEILGSVGYVRCHFAPVTGSWYILFVFGFTAAPTFYISSMHFCVREALLATHYPAATTRISRPSPQRYTILSLGIDFLALVLTVVGSAYAGVKSSDSPSESRPGFDVMASAMVIQLCGLVVMLVVGIDIMVFMVIDRSIARSGARNVNETVVDEAGKRAKTKNEPKQSRMLLAFFAILVFNGLLIFARTIVRIVMLVGGLEGSAIRGITPVNVEQILLFIAILLTTALHPALILRRYRQNAGTA